MKRCGLLLSSLLLLSAAAPAMAAEEPVSGVWTLMIDNDLFYNNDRDYTNGIGMMWVPTGAPVPDWAVRITNALPWFPEEGKIHYGYAAGQNIYTSRDIDLPNPPPDDRPYAGWLYGTAVIAFETGQQLDQLALTLGVVGPAAQAELVQKSVHHIVNATRPQGWDTQLGNELGLILSYQRSWRAVAEATLARLDLDLTPHAGVSLGNVYTYANSGLTLRYGRNLQLDYGPPRIQPSVPGSSIFVASDGFSWYLFGGFEGRAVARNIFLDGNTFQPSRSVEREPFVGDLQWGMVIAWHDVRLSYTHVIRSREFKTQIDNTHFGAFSVSVMF